MLTAQSNNLTIPRGSVFFGVFGDSGTITRWLDFGNCPTLSFSIIQRNQQNFDSIGGNIVLDETIPISSEMKCSLLTDNISQANLMLWGGLNETVTSRPGGIRNEDFSLIKPEFFFLSGNPDHVISVTDSMSRTWVKDVDYEVNAQFKMIRVLNHEYAEAPVITVRYLELERPSSTRYSFTGPKPVEGELRFCAANPVGPSYNYTFHRVALSPSGSHELIGNPNNMDWITLAIQVEVMKKFGETELYSLTEGSAEAMITFEGDALISDDGSALITFA